MKKQNGITLISITIYVISLAIVIGILATTTSFFYKNINDTQEQVEPLAELTNFNSFFIKEIEKTNIKVKYCSPYVGENEVQYIIFNDLNTSKDIRYVYIPDDKAIYRDVGGQGNEDKATVKIARDVENCVFSEEIQNGKSKITVDLTIGSKQQTYTYTANN